MKFSEILVFNVGTESHDPIIHDLKLTILDSLSLHGINDLEIEFIVHD